jgi:hypothetical protein
MEGRILWEARPIVCCIGMGWSPPPLEATLSDKFREEGDARALRELAAKKDINGLLDFALLLNSLNTMETAKCRWAVSEAVSAPAHPVTDRHMAMAAEIMGTAPR